MGVRAGHRPAAPVRPQLPGGHAGGRGPSRHRGRPDVRHTGDAVRDDQPACLRGDPERAFRRLAQSGSGGCDLLALHGAGVAEDADDLEGDLLGKLRADVGPTVPVVVTLDLHANVTLEMARHATALLTVNCYPHVDAYDRGAEAVELAQRIVNGRARPRMHLTRIPMLVPTTATSLSPLKEVNERCRGWEAKPGIIDCTFVHGFAHTDIPPIAASVIAIADGAAAAAREAAEDVASYAWEARGALLRQTLG